MAHFEYCSAVLVAAALACWAGLPSRAALAAEDVPPPAVEDAQPAAEGATPALDGAAAPAADEGVNVADGPPVFLAVIGVRSDDVLHLRDVPSADSKSLANIPPTARDLKKIGCMRVQLSMDRYMYMSKEERRDAQAPWCRVEYKGMQGWVSARYVKEQGEKR